jgi:hypothetical protein
MSARKTRREGDGGTATTGPSRKTIWIPEEIHLELRRIQLTRKGATIQDVAEELLKWALKQEKKRLREEKRSQGR